MHYKYQIFLKREEKIQNKYIKRSLVIIILIIFFGTSILPSISSNSPNIYKDTRSIPKSIQDIKNAY